jgi:poly(A) polymerase
MQPRILTRDQHPISRNDFSEEALKVLYRLEKQEHTAYLAGGCVRDLLLGRKPKDFDVATDAKPNELKRIFRNCRLIGRRFRLAHIFFHNSTIEVATFRSNVPEDADVAKGHVQKKDGLVTRDNQYGTPEEDALRRDFTVNAMFYDIATFSIIDYAGGLDDIEKKLLRCIGDPATRYTEDPVRMIRAVRFASSLGLTIEEEAWQAIIDNHQQMLSASPARMYEEMLKYFLSGAARKLV